MLVVSRRDRGALGDARDRVPAAWVDLTRERFRHAAGRSPRADASQAHAMRHGSCTARAPPGMRTARSEAARSNATRSPTRISPPQMVPSAP